MQALVLDARWDPRPDVALTDEQVERRWAPNANVVYKDPTYELRDIPHPGEPGPGEVLLRVGACGMCGSDLHLIETDEDGFIFLPYHVKTPVVMGHEFSGVIEAVGPGVKDFRVGEIVSVEEIQYCSECFACRGGMYNSCERIEDFGFTIDGAYAEHVIAPTKALWSLEPLLQRYDRETALEVGALCEPTSVAYEGIFTRSGGFKPGAAAAVFGAGPIGLASVALTRAAGASAVIAVEPGEERRQMAERIGASHVIDPTTTDAVEAIREITRGIGVHMAVEASGMWPAVMPSITASLAVGGRAAIVGMGPDNPTVDLLAVQLKGASIHGSVGHCGGWNYGNVINLMGSGRIAMEHAVTHRLSLKEFADTLGSLGKRSHGKVLVKPSL